MFVAALVFLALDDTPPPVVEIVDDVVMAEVGAAGADAAGTGGSNDYLKHYHTTDAQRAARAERNAGGPQAGDAGEHGESQDAGVKEGVAAVEDEEPMQVLRLADFVWARETLARGASGVVREARCALCPDLRASAKRGPDFNCTALFLPQVAGAYSGCESR